MLPFLGFLGLLGSFFAPGLWAQQSYPFFASSPPPPLIVTATANSPFGQSSYCYWVVVVYPIGKSTPSAPSCLSNAIETSSVLISWSAASGASSYDVLRTTTPILPNVTSNIAVATAVSGTTQTDSFGALSSYTIASAVPATANLYLDNTAFSTPQLRAIVTGVGGTTAFNLGSGGTPGGVNGQVQFNNSGAFGGFTVSGDGTLNTGTGVLTVTQVNGAAVPTSAKLISTNASKQLVAAAAETAPITVGATGGIACATCATASASLTSTDCVSGAGSQGIQTPSVNCTVDSSGNLAANSLTVAAGGSAGTVNTNGGNLFGAVIGDNAHFSLRWNAAGTAVSFNTNSSSSAAVGILMSSFIVGSTSNNGNVIATSNQMKTDQVEMNTSGLRNPGQAINFLSTKGICWVNSTSSFGGTSSIGLLFNADGVMEFDNCAAGSTAANMRDFKVRHPLCAGTAPTITTHFNTSGDSIAGNDCSFTVTVGTGTATNTGVVTFGTAWPNPPRCHADDSVTLGQLIQPVATTTTLTMNGWSSTTGAAANWTNSDTITVECNGN